MKVIAWDLVFYFIILFLAIFGLFVLVTGIFPDIILSSEEVRCRTKLYNYCTRVVCDEVPNFDLSDCKKYIKIDRPSKEDCINFGFKCS